jgi:hypothetical protein
MRLVAFGLAGLLAVARPAHALVIDSFNESATPTEAAWGLAEAGWFYTPAFAYTLAGIETKFASAVDIRTVTLEFYDDFEPGKGGALLRSAGFQPAALAFSGGSFAPLDVVSGNTYFVGFRNVGNLGVNFSFGASDLLEIHGSVENDGRYSGFGGSLDYPPILLFNGPDAPEAIPEPGTLFLIGTGLLGLTRARRRKP